MSSERPGVLFLCVANSSRSQMAEALARRFLGARAEVYSAGSKPTKVNPYAIEVMSEQGIDMAGHSAKHVGTIDSAQVDLVITLCAEEVCPIYLGKARQVNWEVPDPAREEVLPRERGVQRFREVRDLIASRISSELAVELDAAMSDQAS